MSSLLTVLLVIGMGIYYIAGIAALSGMIEDRHPHKHMERRLILTLIFLPIFITALPVVFIVGAVQVLYDFASGKE